MKIERSFTGSKEKALAYLINAGNIDALSGEMELVMFNFIRTAPDGSTVNLTAKAFYGPGIDPNVEASGNLEIRVTYANPKEK